MRNKFSLLFLFVVLMIGITYKVTQKKGADVEGVSQNGKPGTTESGTTGKTDLQNPNGQAVGANGQGSVGGVNGSTGNGQGSKAGGVAETTPEQKNNCIAFEYKHKVDAQARDIEDFLDDSNAFPIFHSDVNKNSICVKVNQKPVAFKLNKNKSSDEVLIGSVVGPDSVIRVSYCTGKVKCKESCATPKKRFMDDLMEDASNDEAFHDSWGKGDNDADKKELRNKTKELRAVASENANLNDKSIIRDWDTLQKNEWVCKEK